MSVFFILVEGLDDWPRPVPVAYWGGSETFARYLSMGLEAEFREEAPSLKFSCVEPTSPEGIQAFVSRLAGAADKGEFGEQVQAVCRAADRQKAFLKARESSRVEREKTGKAGSTPPAAKPREGEETGGAGSTPKKARSTKTAGKTPKIPKLSERQYNILVAMLEDGALSPESRITIEKIAVKAEGPNASPEQFKRPMSGLKGLVDSKAGRGGGCWLTEKGRELGELIKNHRGGKR